MLDTRAELPEEVADRLFQPFVTIKANSMEFGLVISGTIVEAHGERIWVSSNSAGAGAACHFELPWRPKTAGKIYS